MEAIANILIRPKRAQYDPSKELGPTKFYLNDEPKQRMDFELQNEFGKTLKCSLFAPLNLKNRHPCVIYCHGNMGCRKDALESVDLLLPHDILIAAFDFSGSGLSDGDYISLGYYEQDDIKSVVKYLRNLGFVSDIGLWGRSMGAASAIMYASKDPDIAALCLDSSFHTLSELCMDTLRSKTFGTFIGGFFFNPVRKAVRNKAKFELDEVVPLRCVPECNMPALFIHGKKDTIVPIAHSRKLFQDYKGHAKIKELDLEHNDARPKLVKTEIKTFFIHKFGEARKRRELNDEVTKVLNNKLHQDNVDATRIEAFLAKITTGERESSRKGSRNNMFQEDRDEANMASNQNFATHKKMNDAYGFRFGSEYVKDYSKRLEEPVFNNKLEPNSGQNIKNPGLKFTSMYEAKNPVLTRGRGSKDGSVSQRKGSVDRDGKEIAHWKAYQSKMIANDYNSDGEM